MDVITRASTSGIALCCGTGRENFKLGFLVEKSEFWCIRNSAAKSWGLRAASSDYSALPSSDFQDKSHVQFYANNSRNSRKKRMLASASATAVDWDKASVKSDDAGIVMVAMEDQKKAEKKMEKKMRKQAKKAAKAVKEGSSSSSSSESEGRLRDERNAQSRKVDMENWRREWESISRSPIMNSIPTFTGVIGQVPSSASASGYSYVRETDSVSPVPVAEESKSDVAVRISRSLNSGVNAGSDVAILPEPMDNASRNQVVVKPRDAASVEVCVAGKCKKAGAEKVISAFQASGVAASACKKCMKNCESAVNVRVLHESERGPRMHSLVGPEDVKSLSRKYFGVGAVPRDSSSGPVVFLDRSEDHDSVLYM